jgi:hypothetical protein
LMMCFIWEYASTRECSDAAWQFARLPRFQATPSI